MLIRDRRGEIVLHGRSGGHNELLRGRCGNRRGYGCNHGNRCTRGLKLKKKKIAQVKIAKLKSQPRRSRSASHRRSRGASLAALAVAVAVTVAVASNRGGKTVVSATESAPERELQTVVRRPTSDMHTKRRCEEDAGRHQDVRRHRRRDEGEDEGSRTRVAGACMSKEHTALANAIGQIKSNSKATETAADAMAVIIRGRHGMALYGR